MVHEDFSLEKLLALHRSHPQAKVIAHPESEQHILKIATFIGSTKKLLDFVQSDDSKEYIVATEAGILHMMNALVPQKLFLPAPSYEENTCACSECEYMKMNTLEKLYLCLRDQQPRIELSDQLIRQAGIPIERMLEI